MNRFLAIDSLYIHVVHISHIELQGIYLDKDGISHDALWIWLRGEEETHRSPEDGLLWLDEEAMRLREPLRQWLSQQSCQLSLKLLDTPDWLSNEAEFQQWLEEVTAVSEKEAV